MDDHNHQLISLDTEYNVRVWDVRRYARKGSNPWLASWASVC